MTAGPSPTAAQAAFLAKLEAFAADLAVPVLAAEVTTTPLSWPATYGGVLTVAVRLDTTRLPAQQRNGLRVDVVHEDVLVLVPDVFPACPPFVHVDHRRFIGTPHVLQGTRLCVYLDPSQEWHPAHTAADFMNRLWTWFCDAVTGRFNARTALYHPVGGVLHKSPGTPLVVARVPLTTDRPFGVMRLVERSPNRLDLRPAGESGAEALTVFPAGPMSLGAGNTLGGLCGALGLIGLPDPYGFGRLCKPRAHAVPPTPDAFLTRLGVTAARGQPGDPLYIVLAVPSMHGADVKRHLICGRLPGDGANRLRALVACSGTLGMRMRDIASIGVEWCLVSEERPEMTTRRDRKTPVQSLVGAHVVILGCGGLGSWIAEFIARAGARRITLSDSAQITGGLLVRQDFTELDVGEKKADALARRLTALRDDLAVDLLPGGNYTLGTPMPKCDLLIDATVDKTAAAALSAAWPTTKHAPLVASVATDRRSATLGLVTLTRPGHGPDPETLDAAAGKAVEARADLQTFACFWRSPEPSEEVNPAPGCSVPTFHGSAADLAAVAGALTRIIAGHLPAPDKAGTHLFAMPHAGHTAGHVWLDHT